MGQNLQCGETDHNNKYTSQESFLGDVVISTFCDDPPVISTLFGGAGDTSVKTFEDVVMIGQVFLWSIEFGRPDIRVISQI